jgi:uncharacterized protein (DUF2252 family)
MGGYIKGTCGFGVKSTVEVGFKTGGSGRATPPNPSFARNTRYHYHPEAMDEPPRQPRTEGEHPRWMSSSERIALGKAARRRVPRSAHAAFDPAARAHDPIDLLSDQARSRVASLVPIRHERMTVSPFTYFRGAALPMAADLASTPDSGFTVQACGDAHLSNFGIFGSPERHLIFDVNDFDETLPGPWEWDVKRLAASLVVAARDNGFPAKRVRAIALGGVCSYRKTIRGFAEMSMIDVWYAHLDLEHLLPRFLEALDPVRTPAVWHAIQKARAHDRIQAFAKLTRRVGDDHEIISDPPLIVPIRELAAEPDIGSLTSRIGEAMGRYAHTLQPDRRRLLQQYRLADLARKVVGVGSVGTQAWIALMIDHTNDDPLFLQLKEAQPSVLAGYLAPSEFSNHGERVVMGQRLMQAASDIFLGWERFSWPDDVRDYYVRQLRDWKGSVDVAGMTPDGMELWAEMCGWTLARAHARSGDRLAIAAYLGSSDVFDEAIAEFAEAYADQNERDFAAMREAMHEGGLLTAAEDA